MLSALARVSSLRPWRVLGVAALFVVLAGAIGGPVASMLNVETDSFSDRTSNSATALELIAEASGAKAAPELIVLADTADADSLVAAQQVLEADPRVVQVVGGPEAGPPFVSTDGSQAFIAATYAAEASTSHTTEDLIAELDDLDGLRMGGFGAAYHAVNEQTEKDLIKAELIAIPLLLIAALWVFRSGVAAVLPLLVGALTIVSSLLFLRGVHEVVEVSNFALNLITGIGLGLAIDYSLFVVSRFREEMARTGPGIEAITRTLATAGRTVIYSAVTVAGAGVSLLVFELRFLYSMGIGLIIVPLVAAAISLVVLPALFALLGERINTGGLKRWRRGIDHDARGEKSGPWYRIATTVMRYPVVIATVTAAFLIALGLPFLGIKFTGVDASVLPAGAEARVVDEVLRADFDGTDSNPLITVVEAPASAGDEVAAFARSTAALPGAEGATDPVHLGGDVWRFDVLPAGATLDDATMDLVDLVRDTPGPGPVHVGGASAEQVDQVASIIDRVPIAVGILALLTFTALFLMTGSVVLPIKALVMNLLTVSATFGLLVLIFQDGRLEGLLNYTSSGALESSQPVFIFAIAFGLSTDYAVFLLTRIKEAHDAGADTTESVALGIARTGRIVTAAAVLLAIAIGAFATSDITFLKQLGIGTAAAVLIDAFIVRTFLVPSLMKLLGEKNWWAPAPLQRLHARIGLREG